MNREEMLERIGEKDCNLRLAIEALVESGMEHHSESTVLSATSFPRTEWDISKLIIEMLGKFDGDLSIADPVVNVFLEKSLKEMKQRARLLNMQLVLAGNIGPEDSSPMSILVCIVAEALQALHSMVTIFALEKCAGSPGDVLRVLFDAVLEREEVYYEAMKDKVLTMDFAQECGCNEEKEKES